MHTLLFTSRARLALLALVGALAVLFAAGSAANAQSATLTGTLIIMHGDPVPEPGGRNPLRQPFYRYLLSDDRGQTTELAIDEAVLARAGGHALDGKRVTVTLAAGSAA